MSQRQQDISAPTRRPSHPARRAKVRAPLAALVAGAALWLGGAAVARADQVKYVGGHPTLDGGFCQIEVPHVHTYAPPTKRNQRKLLYRVHAGYYHFVGDPVAHGYDGERVSYYGHHPIVIDTVVDAQPVHDFCYLDGPHFHAFGPPVGASFELKGDTYWFVGAYPARYKRDKKARVRINTYYAAVPYPRPTVVVTPPRAYVGAFFPMPPVPSVEVRASAGVRPVVPHVRAGVRVRGPVIGVHGARHRRAKFARSHKSKRHRGRRFKRSKKGGRVRVVAHKRGKARRRHKRKR